MKIYTPLYFGIIGALILLLNTPIDAFADSDFLKNLIKIGEKIENFKEKKSIPQEEVKVNVNNIEKRSIKDIALDFEGNLIAFSTELVDISIDISGLSPEGYSVWDVKSNRLVDSISFGFDVNYASFKNDHEVIAFNYSRNKKSSKYGVFDFLEKRSTAFNFNNIAHQHSTGGLLAAGPDEVCGVRYVFFVSGNKAKYVCENNQSKNLDLILPRDLDKIDDAILGAAKNANPFHVFQKMLLNGLNTQHHVFGFKYNKINLSMARLAPMLAFLDDETNVTIYNLTNGTIYKQIKLEPLDVLPEDSGHEKIERRIALSPDGSKLAVTNFFSIQIYSLTDGRMEQEIPVFRGLPSALTWSGNSKRLGIGYKGGGISVYEYNFAISENAKEFGKIETMNSDISDAYAINFTAGLYGTRDSKGNLNIWNIKTNELVKSIPVPSRNFMQGRINDEGTYFLLFGKIMDGEDSPSKSIFSGLTKNRAASLIIVDLKNGKVSESSIQIDELNSILEVSFLKTANQALVTTSNKIIAINLDDNKIIYDFNTEEYCPIATAAMPLSKAQQVLIACSTGELLRYSAKYKKISPVPSGFSTQNNILGLNKSFDENHVLINSTNSAFHFNIENGIVGSGLDVYRGQAFFKTKDGEIIVADQTNQKLLLKVDNHIVSLLTLPKPLIFMDFNGSEFFALTGFFGKNYRPVELSFIKIKLEFPLKEIAKKNREVAFVNLSDSDVYDRLVFSEKGKYLVRNNSALPIELFASGTDFKAHSAPPSWKLEEGEYAEISALNSEKYALALVNKTFNDRRGRTIFYDDTDTLKYLKVGEEHIYGYQWSDPPIKWRYKLRSRKVQGDDEPNQIKCQNNIITTDFIMMHCSDTGRADFLDVIDIRNGKSKGTISLNKSYSDHTSESFSSYKNKVYSIFENKYVFEIDLERMSSKPIISISNPNSDSLNISVNPQKGHAIVYNKTGSVMTKIDLTTLNFSLLQFPKFEKSSEEKNSTNGTLNQRLCWLSENEFIFFSNDLNFSKDYIRYFDLSTATAWDATIQRSGLSVSSLGEDCKKVVNFQVNKIFAISDGKSNIYFKNIKNGKTILTASFSPAGQSWAIFSPDGFFDVSDHTLLEKLSISRDKSIVQLEKVYDYFYRPDIIKNILAGNDEYVKRETANSTIDDVLKTPGPTVTNLKISSDQPNSTTINISYTIKDQGGGIGEIVILNNGKVVKNGGVYKDTLKAKRVAMPKQEPQRKGNKRLGTELAVDTKIEPTAGAQQGSTKLPPNEKSELSEKVEITVTPGEINEITVVARNKANTFFGPKSSVSFNSPLPKREPHLWLLSVGIGKFSDTRINGLVSPKKDATDFACSYAGQVALKKIGIECLKTGYANSIYKSENIHVFAPLIDSGADRASILAKLDEIARLAHPSDTFIWFASTHGTMDENGVYGIAPYDLKCQDNHCARSKGLVSANDILERSKSIKATKQMLILDTCQAGGLDNKFSGLYDARISALAKNVGLHIFAAATSIESALDGEATTQNSVFTSALLEGMEAGTLLDKNLDGTVSAIELGEFVKKQTPLISKKIWKNLQFQSPVVRHFGKDIPIREVQ